MDCLKKFIFLFFEISSSKFSVLVRFLSFPELYFCKNVSIFKSKPLIKNLVDRSSQKCSLSLEIKAYDYWIIINTYFLIFVMPRNTHFWHFG